MTILAAVRVPQETKWSPGAAIGLMNAVVERYQVPEKQISQHLTELLLVGYSGLIEWNLFTTLTDEIDGFAALVRAYYPNAEVYPSYIETRFNYPLFKKSGVLCRSYKMSPLLPAYLSATTVRPTSDPLVHLIQAMNELQDQEMAVYRIQLFDCQIRKQPWWAKAMVFFADEMARQGNPMKMIPPKDQERLMIEARRKLPLVNLAQAVEMYTPNPDRFYIFDNLLATLRNFTANGYPVYDEHYPHQTKIGSEDQLWESFGVIGDLSHLPQHPDDVDFFMTQDEIATLWHLPHDQFTASKMDIIRPDLTKLPNALKGVLGILLGHNNGEEVRLPIEDRTTHTMIIGKSGTGKSSLMHRMIHEDIAAGYGVCVLDPHGELISNILRASIPDHRVDDVVILDLAMKVNDIHYPPPFNPLHQEEDGKVSQNIVATLRRIDSKFADTQMEYLLELALKTLNATENPTLYDVQRLYKDPTFRQQAIGKAIKVNMSLQLDWDDYLHRSEAQQRKDVFPLLRRLNQTFLGTNKTLAVACHPDSVNFPALLSQNKIILVDLGAEDTPLDEEARLILGSSLVAQVETAAAKRAIKDKCFMLYIDEAQEFVNTPLSKMLSRVRKLGLGLVLANQYLKQWTNETQSAIEGNVGTMISFEIGQDDADTMKSYMTTFDKEQLVSLGKYRAAVSMRYGDQRLNAFRLETLPPPGVDLDGAQGQAREQLIRQRSVANYTPKPYDEVVTWLQQRYFGNGDSSQSPAADDSGDDDGIEEG